MGKDLDTIRLQPTPETVSVAHLVVYGQDYTAISRLWPPGSKELCRLCDRCTIRGTRSRLCTVVVSEHVSRDEAWHYDGRGAKDVTPDAGSSDGLVAVADPRRLRGLGRKSV